MQGNDSRSGRPTSSYARVLTCPKWPWLRWRPSRLSSSRSVGGCAFAPWNASAPGSGAVPGVAGSPRLGDGGGERSGLSAFFSRLQPRPPGVCTRQPRRPPAAHEEIVATGLRSHRAHDRGRHRQSPGRGGDPRLPGLRRESPDARRGQHFRRAYSGRNRITHSSPSRSLIPARTRPRSTSRIGCPFLRKRAIQSYYLKDGLVGLPYRMPTEHHTLAKMLDALEAPRDAVVVRERNPALQRSRGWADVVGRRTVKVNPERRV